MITDVSIDGITIDYLGADRDPDLLYAWIRHQPMVGFDVETGGPDPLNPFAPGFEVRLISFATPGGNVIVVHGSHREAIRDALQDEDRIFVAHNGAFDTLAVRSFYDVDPIYVIDTFLLALLVNPPAGDDGADDLHALKPLSTQTGSTALVDAETALHGCFAELEPRPEGGDQSNAVREWEGRGFATVAVDEPRYWIYNGLDSAFGLRVLDHLLKQWDGKVADAKRLLAVECELNQLLSGVTWRGLRVDRGALGALFRAAVKAQEAMKPAFAALHVTNPRSNPDLSQAFTKLGVLTPALSDAGQISTDKLEGMPRLLDPDQPDEVRRLAQLLLEFRGHQGLRAKTREIADLVSKGDGHRVHPRLNALKARTGRMSIQDPALQNLPKNDPRIRAAFLAEDGMVLVGADFSQVEFRVAAALSEDPQMIAAVRSGMDLHNFTATQIFGPDFTPEQRGLAKNTGFCIQYGGGVNRVARMTGLSHRAAEKMIQLFYRTYPGLQRYIAKVNKRTSIELPSGRRAAVDPDRRYANLNYFVQGTARDIFVDALLRLWEAGWGEWLWLVVHDEIILQVPIGQEDAACAALEAAMTTSFRGVPITAEAKVLGSRWGHLPEPDSEIKDAA